MRLRRNGLQRHHRVLISARMAPTRTTYYLGVDIGGTNCRAQLVNTSGGPPLEQHTSRLDNLLDCRAFLDAVVATVGGWSAVKRCVVGFAGPVVARAQASLTNWPGTPQITLAEFSRWTGGDTRTLFPNDMEVTALGVVTASPKECIELHPGAQAAHDASATRDVSANSQVAIGVARTLETILVLAPGTGFGSAAVRRVNPKTSVLLDEMLPSELGHAGASPTDARTCRS
jgi:glucokinase